MPEFGGIKPGFSAVFSLAICEKLCYTFLQSKMNMPLSRVTEGTGPLMSGNLHFLQGANSCGMAMPKDEDFEPLIFVSGSFFPKIPCGGCE